MVKVLAAVAVVLALFVGTAGTATAAPPKDVTYSWPYEQLSADPSVYHAIVGTVRYSRDGTATTQCAYFKRTPNSYSMTPDGVYRVNYAIADTSNAGVKSFCIANFHNRV